MVPKEKGKSACDLSDKAKVFNLLNGFSKSWAVLWENELSICSTALKSMHPEHLRFFLNSSLLGITDPWIPRVHCILAKFFQKDKTKTSLFKLL
jgi:hypothetical protein